MGLTLLVKNLYNDFTQRSKLYIFKLFHQPSHRAMNYVIKSIKTIPKLSPFILKRTPSKTSILSHFLFKQPYHRFSVIKSDKNPNQMPEQLKKLMEEQKSKHKVKQLPILKDISVIKTVQQLREICKKLNFMSKENREIAVRYLLSAIYQKKLPVQAIEEKILQGVVAEFPHLKLETEVFQINYYISVIHGLKDQMRYIRHQKEETNNDGKTQNKKIIAETYKKINDLYYNAFSVTLKNISPQHIARSKATLYKHFAQYNSQQIFNSKLTQKSSPQFQANTKTLKKSRDFIIESLKCHKDIILVQYKKLQSDQIKTLKEQSTERHAIKINAIKENIRKIVQSAGQCLYSYFKVINKQYRTLKDPFEHKNRKLQLLSLIQSYLPLYSVVPGNFSQQMCRDKINIDYVPQAKFTSQEPRDQTHAQQKIKQAVEDYSRLFSECSQALQQAIKLDNFNNMKQISTLMISTKYMIGRNIKKNQVQLKNNLAIVAKEIIDQMKQDFKKPMQHYMLEFIKQILQLKS